MVFTPVSCLYQIPFLAWKRSNLPEEEKPLVLPSRVVGGDVKRPGYLLSFDGQVLNALIREDRCICRGRDQPGVGDDELVQADRREEGYQEIFFRETAEPVDLNEVRRQEDLEGPGVLLLPCPCPGFFMGEEDGCKLAGVIGWCCHGERLHGKVK